MGEAVKRRTVIAVVYGVVLAWSILVVFISSQQTREIRHNERLILDTQATLVAGQQSIRDRQATSFAGVSTFVAGGGRRATPTP